MNFANLELHAQLKNEHASTWTGDNLKDAVLLNRTLLVLNKQTKYSFSMSYTAKMIVYVLKGDILKKNHFF